MLHVVFDLFTFREHKILYDWDKFLGGITVGITFRTQKKIPVKFLDIAFKRNKQKHYLLIIPGIFGKFHIKSSRKNQNLHHPRQNFFSFGPWLDTLKLERNPKFQVLGSSGTLLFQPFRIEPLDQKMTATMWKCGLPYVSWFQFLREVFTQ